MLSLLVYYYHQFSHLRKLMVLYWSLSDSRLPQVSRTPPCILSKKALIRMVSIRPWISVFFLSFRNCAPIKISITITLMLHRFLSYPTRSKYLYLFSFSFLFTLWPTETSLSAILLLLLLITSRSGLLAGIR